MPFFCAICEEESTRICVRCTKDTCSNHICERCGKCSDCCECELMLDEPVREPARSVIQSAAAARQHEVSSIPVPEPEPAPPVPSPDPAPPVPSPDPDPFPEPEPTQPVPSPDPDPFPEPEPEPQGPVQP
jgi:hypothetical protein